MAQNDLSSTYTATAVDFDPFAGGEVDQTAPITESQKEIWLSAQMSASANCAFNQSVSVVLKGELNETALWEAMAALVERHEALRTTFSLDGSTLCISEFLELDTPTLDLTGLTEAEQRDRIAALKTEAVETPFDLENGPLMRVQLIQQGPQLHHLLITNHHIICDGWSWEPLLKNLAAIYSANVQGTTPELPEVEQFSNYAQTLYAEKNDAEQKAAEAYWVQQYADSVPVLDLTSDRARPPVRTFNADREDWPINSDLIEKVKAAGVKFNASFVNVLLAAYEVLLYRWSGQEDIVVGISAAGQAYSGRYELVGHCVSMLPVRSRIDPQQAFSDYLGARRAALLDAYDHQKLTFGSLLNQIQLPRDASRIPLIPVTFNFDREIEPEELAFVGLEVEQYSNPRHFENFEVFLNITERCDGSVLLECQYNTDLFDRETIRRRLQEYQVLLEAIATDPSLLLCELPILTSEERNLLATWNRTEAAIPQPALIHEQFAAQVAKTPDAVAVIFEDRHLTYKELDNRANQLAHYLISLGVQPDSFVGIAVDRGLEMMVALLGVLKAGGAYIPLDPAFPRDRLEYMLEDSQASVLISNQSSVISNQVPTNNQHSQVPQGNAKVVCLDSDTSYQSCPTTPPTSSVQPNNLAYVIYTSGSTGKPKGVQVPHQTVVNFLASMAQTPGLQAEDTLLSVTTLSFDIAVLELFLPLMVGAKTVLVSRDVAMDGRQLLERINRHNVTTMQATPATWRLLLAVINHQSSVNSHQSTVTNNQQQITNLKVLCGGEALPPDLATELIQHAESVWNMYGPTETTVWSTCARVTSAQPPISIGKPIANTQIYILDPQQKLVPIGVPGELYIGGSGVARGYLNRPDLTQERFVRDPFSREAEARMYRTGDQVRWRPDGTLEYFKRLDYQVKVRGFRIELGEIETALAQHPNVRQVAVVARADASGANALFGYVVPHQADESLGTQLRSFLKEQLPDYMIPGIFLILEAMPLTPNGKIDRRALPTADAAQQESHNYVAPRNEIERAIAAIWAAILGLKQVGVETNFFELGGHSLLAIQVMQKVNEALNVELPFGTLFQASTIASLKERVEAAQYVQGKAVEADDDEDREEFEI
jgi:amino acid adenylation domain-containing protein